MGIKEPINRLPSWMKMKSRLPKDGDYYKVRELVDKNKLHTICTSGNCPNIGECWDSGTATFMILGDVCTRSCKFCNVKTGRPGPVDTIEAQRIAESIVKMGLRHAVITSVDRDDLDDKGASIWADTIRACKKACPSLTIECLIPDFDGIPELINQVINEKPEVISHNLETVRRLSPEIRSRAKYDLSLQVLQQIAQSGLITKSGIMLGLGETKDEVINTMKDLLNVDCSVITIGQYMQPSRDHMPVKRWITPDEFADFLSIGRDLGFKHIESDPLVRSSYHAEKHIK